MSIAEHKPALPMDVIYDIIGELASSTEDACEYDPGVKATLHSLSLASRDLNRWSTPYLYRRVSSRHSRLLSLSWSPESAIIQVRALLLWYWGDARHLQDRVRLLSFVSSTLERLMVLELKAGEVQDLVRTSPKMAVLRDFVFAKGTNMKVNPSKAAMWPNVRRVALLGGRMYLEYAFPKLEVLVLSVPEGTASAPFPRTISKIINQHPSLCQILLIMPGCFTGSARDRLDLATAVRGRVSIVEVHHGFEQAGDGYDWMVDHARRGTIWTLPGDDWLSSRRGS